LLTPATGDYAIIIVADIFIDYAITVAATDYAALRQDLFSQLRQRRQLYVARIIIDTVLY